MNDPSDFVSDLQTVALIHELRQMRGSQCKECDAVLCGHELLMNVVAGCKHSPRCLSCLSRWMGGDPDDIRDHLYNYIMRRACRRAAWLWASKEEQVAALPACLCLTSASGAQPERNMSDLPANQTPDFTPAAEWDAGNMGCGELVMELRLRLQALHPKQVLKLMATDEGAREDLPAWCRLTGHKLVLSKHPQYWIQRKES